jgi:drug/metabolite transporter (DMT)-like permease
MTLVGGSVAVSHALVGAPLFTAQAIRYAIAAVILFLLARAAQVPVLRPRGRDWAYLAGIAATGLVLFNIAIVRGVAHAEPAVIAVAVACVPILLGVMGPLLERQAPRRHVLLGAAVVTAGSVLVVGTSRAGLAGAGWAVVALACESAFTLLAVPVLPRHGAWGVSLHSVWIGAVMLLMLGASTEGVAAAARLTPADWAALAYLAIMVTAVAFILWYSTVATLGAGRAGLLTGIAPVSAALTGMATGSRAPATLAWAGMLTVMAGLAIGLRSPRRQHRGPQKRQSDDTKRPYRLPRQPLNRRPGARAKKEWSTGHAGHGREAVSVRAEPAIQNHIGTPNDHIT